MPHDDLGPTTEATIREIEAFFTTNYADLVAAVRRRVGANEPERWVHEALIKAHTQVLKLGEDDEAGHLSARERWTTPPYVIKTALRKYIDKTRRGKISVALISDRPRQTEATDPNAHESFDLDRDLTDHEAQEPDQVPAALVDQRRRQALRTVLRVLTQRGQLHPTPSTAITEAQWTTLQALGSGGVEDATDPLTDEELHQAVLERHRKARERWTVVLDALRAGQEWPRRQDGGEAAAARQLGVHRSTVNRRLAGVRDAVAVTRYVAGVLAPPQTLLDASRIQLHLDAFDGLVSSAPDDRHLLSSAAPHVRTTEETGTRVDQQAFAERLVRQVAELHAAETSFARDTRTPYPNCVTLCADHNPTANRATEI